MATKPGKKFLDNSGSDRELVRELRRIKTQKKELGQNVILHQFIKNVSPNYKFYKVHAELTKQLQRIIDGECKRLIIQIPPRTGKSFLSSKLFPAAYLMAHPDRYAGIVSYSAELAEGFSRSARDYYQQAGGIFDPVKRAVNDWGTQGGGGLWAAGVGGAITGRSGHLLIVDDPVKNREDADSPRVMEKLWDWYTSTLYTRLEPNVGSIVVIQCMTGDTDVTMADGSRKVLKDIKPGDEILSWKDGKHCRQKVLNHVCQGEDDVFELRTESSRVKANARHPFLVQRLDGSQEWVRLKDLRVGDELVASSLTKNCNLQYNPWSQDDQEFRTQKIRSIKPAGREDVYDIQVEGTECFIADGLVSHNTRWSENDLIGRLIESEMNVSEKGRENWTILDLPAISEDPGSRPPLPDHCDVVPDWREEPGIALCPQRYGIEEYERIREAIGTRDFAALYQQRPAPEGGNMFNPEWWQYYDHSTEMPEFQRVMLSVDCTFTDSSKSDYVVGSVIAQAGNRFYVLDMVRERMDIIGTITMISRMYNKHQLSGTIIELAASGYAAYQMLNKKVPGLIGFKPEKSKVARSAGIVPIVEAGNVFLPASAPWLDTFLNEFSLFPAAKNDDIVDSIGMAINYMSQRIAPQMTEVSWGRGANLSYNNTSNSILRGS